MEWHFLGGQKSLKRALFGELPNFYDLISTNPLFGCVYFTTCPDLYLSPNEPTAPGFAGMDTGSMQLGSAQAKGRRVLEVGGP